MYFIFFIFAIIFLAVSIIISIFDVKKRKLEGLERIKTISLYLYFGISMSLFSIFVAINALVSILIFSVISLKHKKHLFPMLECLSQFRIMYEGRI